MSSNSRSSSSASDTAAAVPRATQSPYPTTDASQPHTPTPGTSLKKPSASQQRQQARGKTSGNGTARLFVGQLNFEATELEVREIFSFYGHVLHVNILRGNDGKSTGSAFVTYGTTEEADNAILSMHDHYNMGRDKPLQVSYCRRSECFSEFGITHALMLRESNKSNPLPPQRVQ